MKYFISMVFAILFISSNAYAVLVDGTDSDVTKYTFTPNEVFVHEKGFIKWAPDYSKTQTFSTTKRCPGSFKPYIELEFQRIGGGGTSTQWAHLRTFGICVTQVQTNASSYAVTYYSVKNYADVYNSKFPLYNYKQGQNDYPQYGSTDDTYYLGYLEKLGYYGITLQGNAVYQEIGGLDWTLYCYPEALATPYNQQTNGSTECETTIPPFASAGPGNT